MQIEATVLWQDFNQKYKTVTGDAAQLEAERARHSKTDKEATSLLTSQEAEAGTKIAAWWKLWRSSKRFSTFNPQGAHPDQFHTLLNGKTNIKRKFDHDGDQKLLRELESNPWKSDLFRNPDTHYNALNLFASGKITWQQKATLSLVIEICQHFDRYEAIELLNKEGTDFSEEAMPLVKNYIRYFPIHTSNPFIAPCNGFLTEEETKRLIALVHELPKSEQFIFAFREQRNNAEFPEGFPSKDVRARYQYARLLNRDGPDYQGILFFSHGIRDAIGLAHYGIKDWVPLIPRLGMQSIEDVEALSKKGARVAISAESRMLGLTKDQVSIHGSMVIYPDQFSHDEYHSCIASILGSEVLHALDAVIELTRAHFGIRWSKDIWNLRDADLSTLQTFNRNIADKSPAYITDLFATSLNHRYGNDLLSSCRDEMKDLYNRPILLGKDRYPSQILLNFALDLVINSKKWLDLSILDDEKLYPGVMCRLIKMVKYLKTTMMLSEHTIDTSKANILMLDYFVRSYGPCYRIDPDEFEVEIIWNEWKEPQSPPTELFCKMKQIAEDAEVYLPTVKNKQLLFGFIKSEEAVKKREESIAYQLSKNPALATDAVWIQSAYLKACETGNSANISYFFEHLNRHLDFETLHKGFAKACDIVFFDWLIAHTRILQIGDEKKSFPADFADISSDQELKGSSPDMWTTEQIVALKMSEDSQAAIELEKMRLDYAVYLNRLRSKLQTL